MIGRKEPSAYDDFDNDYKRAGNNDLNFKDRNVTENFDAEG